LCIRKLFYHCKDDELQKILFGEVLHKYKCFTKTTLPMSYIYPKRNNNAWLCNRIGTIYGSIGLFVKLNYDSIETLNKYEDLHDKVLKYNNRSLYEVLVTFQTREKTKKKLLIKIEYIDKESNESVFSFLLTEDPPLNLEELRTAIRKKIIN